MLEDLCTTLLVLECIKCEVSEILDQQDYDHPLDHFDAWDEPVSKAVGWMN